MGQKKVSSIVPDTWATEEVKVVASMRFVRRTQLIRLGLRSQEPVLNYRRMRHPPSRNCEC